jgi:hypothetical protein
MIKLIDQAARFLFGCLDTTKELTISSSKKIAKVAETIQNVIWLAGSKRSLSNKPIIWARCSDGTVPYWTPSLRCGWVTVYQILANLPRN